MAQASPLALTQGDPSGIGPEIALMAWKKRAELKAPFFLLADPEHIARLSAQLGWTVPQRIVEPEETGSTFAEALPIVRLDAHVAAQPGRSDPADGVATIEAIRRAVDFVQTGRAGAVVTNPIAKEVLYRSGFAYPGHTEFLGALASREDEPVTPVMMLWSPLLAVVPATIHIPLADVRPTLSRELVSTTARITARDLSQRFGIPRPRLAICGLNPHAGESGSMGREEIEIIAPAIAELRAEGIDARGPYPADTLFHAAARTRYDVAICMYHDQALIPIKTLAFDSAVNVTLGLPFIRTSPDHGTAFDIAGRGIADPGSLLAALGLAADLAARIHAP